ncbi:MAG: hypothetical protein RBR71_13535 [Gudongella sp.]|jgi:hypothetical protein|nr:hypothetical protein [Bacteroidales bacterium]MDY0237042.1 hypothetical protein [Gudongella sp.]
MKKIYLLCDYKRNFGSKRDDFPYRSGMEKELLKKLFVQNDFDAAFLTFAEANTLNIDWNNIPVLYTSTEDIGYKYKSFIDDVVLGLELKGANLLPPYKFLHATNNKVFMEILRTNIPDELSGNVNSFVFGGYEEFINNLLPIEYPAIIKEPAGAKSNGVYLARNIDQAKRIVKKISITPNLKEDIKDWLRAKTHNGYIKESRYRNKFVIQNFVPNLEYDYKVLIYGKKYYVLKRNNRPKDFRASGSGLFEFREDIPFETLNYAEKLFNYFQVPNLSLDIAFNNNQCFLLEFQAVFFGSTTLVKSPFYFVNENAVWKVVQGKSILEEEFVNSVVQFLNKVK